MTGGERECVKHPFNVFQRINLAGQILQENQWIKDMQTSAYKSVDIDQIRRHVGAAEVQAGLVAIYTEDTFERFELNGKTLARITATITYVNIDEPSDRVDFVRSAVAFDSGDKGYNKCESMIYKNLYKGLYHIGERNEDPDATSNDENEILETVRWDRDALAEIMAIVKAHASALIDKAGKLGETIGEKLNFKNIIKELTHFDFGGLWSNVTSGAHNAWGKIKGFGVDAFGKIADFGGDSWTWIKGKASDAWHGIKGFGENAWGKIGEKGSEIWHKMLDFGHDFKENVMDKLRAGFDHIKELVENIKKKIEEIVDKVKEITTGAVGGVKDFVKDPLGGIKHIGGKAVDKVKGLFGFADGGVVKPNNPFPVIVGDNTKEPEVISPVSTLQHAVKEAIQSMGGQSAMSGGPIELTVNLDGRKIARAVYDPLQTESRRRGAGA